METRPVPAAVVTASEPGPLISRYASQIAGQLGCFDRVILPGNLLDACRPAGLERQLYAANLRCFDLGLFAEPLSPCRTDQRLSPPHRRRADQALARTGRAETLRHTRAGLAPECTANGVTFFKHSRKVEHRKGPPTCQVAALKKSLCSRGDLAELMRAACARYLAFPSALEDRPGGAVNLQPITEPALDEHRSFRGFNFFAAGDLSVLLAILRGEHPISGLSHRLL